MGFTLQDSDQNGNQSKSVELPKDFYKAEFKEANAYVKDDDRRLALIFEIKYDDERVEVGRFLTAKATTYSDDLKADSQVSDSDLGALFADCGLLKALELELSSRIQAVEWFEDEVPEGFLTEKEGGFNATDDDEHDLLAEAVQAQLEGHVFKVLAVNPEGDGGSLIEDIDPVEDHDYEADREFSGGESESDDTEEASESEAEDGDEDILFDDESDALDEQKDTLNA
jgi:hypothetical protein